MTGTFTHETANNLLDVYVAGLDKPIGTTTNHPFWSEDRQAFVHAGWLNVGERVRTGSAERSRVTALNRKPGTATVYTLEVDVEHVYLVSDLAVLVHNTTPDVPGGGTKGYRVMSQAEIDDIAENGWRGAKDTMKDKHFLNDLDDARQWADEVASDLGLPADGIAEVDIPDDIAQRAGNTINVDGIGDGKVVWEPDVPNLPPPTTIHPPN